MGRPYLTNQHGIGRAFGYPGGALPEAVWIIERQPPNPPAPPEMFDPRFVPLYFEQIIPSSQPDAGPIVQFRRDWIGDPWCVLPVTPPELVPFNGTFRYTIQFWPESADPEGDPPRAALIRTRFDVTWVNWASFPWVYRSDWGTLTGLPGRVGWNLPLYSLGFASPPCSIGEWVNGWLGIDVGPVPWDALSEPFTYAESTPHDFTA
jgi:hypothetical protein